MSDKETETEITEMDIGLTDGKALFAHMNYQDEVMVCKRRYLLGIATEEEKLKFQGDNFSCLLESFLRKDDLFYARLVKRFHCNEGDHITEDNPPVMLLLPTISRLRASLDKMTNEGLHRVAMVLSDDGSPRRFENTRSLMIKFIKDYLSDISTHRHLTIYTQLSQVLNNSQNYYTHECPTTLTRTAAVEIIRHLEDLDTQTLMAMQRKLRGVGGGIPQTHRPKGQGKRSVVLNQVRQTCEKMLLESRKDEELLEPLAKAMAVAGLSLKLKRGFYDPDAAEFHHFSPEIMSLHNEIAKAIWWMKDKVGTHKLKDLHLRLDPAATVSIGSLRTAIKKLLTEYLFDCDDMDSIPKSISETLAIINQTSRTVPYILFSNENVEEEVECVLNLSAQIKQVALDSLPDIDFDEDYAVAHMEDLEESEDDDCDDDEDAKLQRLLLEYLQTHISRIDDSQLEDVGESNGMASKPLSCVTQGTGFLPPSKVAFCEDFGRDVIMDLTNSPGPSVLSEQEKLVDGQHSASNNRFLVVQEICDNTSMVAYDLIGSMLKEFARQGSIKLDKVVEMYLKGNNLIPGHPQTAKEKCDSCMEDMDGSSIVRVVEELIPQIGKEALEKLRRLLL